MEADAHPAAVGARLGQVAYHRLALDQLDHERLGLEPAGFGRIAKMSHLWRGEALQAHRHTADPERVAIGNAGSTDQALTGAGGQAEDQH